MTRCKIFYSFVLLILSFAFFSCGATSTDTQNDGSISGVTITTNGGKSAKVYLYDTSNFQTPKDSVFSDSEGYFSFTQLSSGQYAIRTVDGDSVAASRLVSLSSHENKNITLLMVVNITINIYLPDSLKTNKAIIYGKEVNLDSILKMSIDPNGFNTVTLVNSQQSQTTQKNYAIQNSGGQYVLIPLDEYLKLLGTSSTTQASSTTISSTQLSSTPISSSAQNTSSSGGSTDTCVTQQPDGATGIDALVQSLSGTENNTNGNNGQFIASAWLHNGQGFSILRTFFKFDLSMIPKAATLTKANLSLFSWDSAAGMGWHQVTSTGTNDIYIQRVTQDWDEQTITWNNQASTTSTNQVFVLGSTDRTQSYPNIDLKALTQDIVNAGQNYGFMMRQVDEVNEGRKLNFKSSDVEQTDQRPKFEVCWKR